MQDRDVRLATAEEVAQYCEDMTGVRPRVEIAGGQAKLFIDPLVAQDDVVLRWYNQLLGHGSVSHTSGEPGVGQPHVVMMLDQ